jgi:hypothetical protein
MRWQFRPNPSTCNRSLAGCVTCRPALVSGQGKRCSVLMCLVSDISPMSRSGLFRMVRAIRNHYDSVVRKSFSEPTLTEA